MTIRSSSILHICGATGHQCCHNATPYTLSHKRSLKYHATSGARRGRTLPRKPLLRRIPKSIIAILTFVVPPHQSGSIEFPAKAQQGLVISDREIGRAHV